MPDCTCKKSEAQTDVRDQVDQLDREIMKLLIQRMELSASMAAAKKNTALPLFDYAREQDILKKMPGCCCQSSLEKQSRFCSAGIRVYEEILRQSRRIQAKELLPKVIFLVGPAAEKKKQIGRELADILGFAFLDTKTEWPIQPSQVDARAVLSQIFLQKELVICCDCTLLSDEINQQELQSTSACILIDDMENHAPKPESCLRVASHILHVGEGTSAEAAQQIIQLLRA